MDDEVVLPVVGAADLESAMMKVMSVENEG